MLACCALSEFENKSTAARGQAPFWLSLKPQDVSYDLRKRSRQAGTALEAPAYLDKTCAFCSRLFVVIVAMGGNLAANFAARKTSCVHIRIGGPGTERS